MFESALEAGLVAAGADVGLLGPMPTPAVAYLTRSMRAQAGIVISASHNPHHDNGIKFFSANGEKLSDEVELAIEQEIDAEFVTVPSERLGKARRIDDAVARYAEYCKAHRGGGLQPARAQARAGLRARRDLPGGAENVCRAGRRGDRHRRQAGWLQHQPRSRLDPSAGPATGGAGARRRPRHRVRWRWRSRAAGRPAWRTGRRRRHPLRAGAQLACAGNAEGAGGRHPDEQLRPAAGAGRTRRAADPRQRGRPLRDCSS